MMFLLIQNIPRDRGHLRLYLRCEPNDLYEWKPNRDTVNPEDHPLKALRRDDKAAAFREMIRNLPLDKIDQAEAMLAGLQSSE